MISKNQAVCTPWEEIIYNSTPNTHTTITYHKPIITQSSLHCQSFSPIYCLTHTHPPPPSLPYSPPHWKFFRESESCRRLIAGENLPIVSHADTPECREAILSVLLYQWYMYADIAVYPECREAILSVLLYQWYMYADIAVYPECREAILSVLLYQWYMYADIVVYPECREAILSVLLYQWYMYTI